jgi:indole-3-glycerol phosphate synthase
VKRNSPSEGVIKKDAGIEEFVSTYVAAGARCVSVLTEGRRFGGSVEDLRTARRVTSAPLLRKDFVVHPYMIDEAADAGADCILLVAAAVEPTELLELAAAADSAGLEVLLELVFERDLSILRLRDWPLVGINSRNLETLEIDPNRFAALAPLAQHPGRLLVAESGLRTAADIRRVMEQGAAAALVGEALMRSQDPASLIRELRRAGGQV